MAPKEGGEIHETPHHARFHAILAALRSGLLDPAHWSYENHLLAPHSWVGYSLGTVICSSPDCMSDLFRNITSRKVIKDIAFLPVRKLDRTIAPWTGRTDVDPLTLEVSSRDV